MIDLSMIENELLKTPNIIGVYGLFSGGHDSLTACHAASGHPAFRGVIHIDTTTGLRETQEFVTETAAAHNWPLIIQRPYWGYESIIIRRGFPGPAAHMETYNKLKYRPLLMATKAIKARLPQDEKRRAKIILVSGVRSQESDRRAEINALPHAEGSWLWLPLISDLTATDCASYIRNHALRRSPVKDKIHMSGECFCGAFARPSEFQEIEYWYPYQADRIRYWQSLVSLVAARRELDIAAGLAPATESIKREHCRWGWKDGLPQEQMSMPMCWHCRGGQ